MQQDIKYDVKNGFNQLLPYSHFFKSYFLLVQSRLKETSLYVEVQVFLYMYRRDDSWSVYGCLKMDFYLNVHFPCLESQVLTLFFQKLTIKNVSRPTQNRPRRKDCVFSSL